MVVDKSKEQLKPEEPSKNNFQGTPLDHHVGTREEFKKTLEVHTKDAIKALKQEMNASTQGARANLDIPSLRQEQFEKLIEIEIRKNQKVTLDKIQDMFSTYDKKEDYVKFLGEVNALVEQSKQDTARLQQAILAAVRCLAGYNGKIESEDYAYFYTLLGNISDLYSKDKKIGEILVNLQKENLTPKDWDVICNNIKSKSLTRTPNSAHDELKLNTSAFFVQLMTPRQRTELLLEFNKRHGANHATLLTDQMVNSGAITLKQHEVVMSEITGSPYIRTDKEEKVIKEQQSRTEALTKKINGNINSALAINPAERLLNRKSLGSLLVTGIGVMGMLTNYMAGLNNGKGVGRFINGLKNPYFLFSMGVAGGGYHMLTASMHPGKSVGAFDKLIGKPKPLDNLFGTHDKAAVQDDQMKVLAGICGEQKVIEDWLLKEKGFDDVWGFYQKKNFDQTKLKSGMLTTQQKADAKNGKKKGLYDEFLEYVENEPDKGGRGNKRGALKLKEAKRLYGKAGAERMIFNITVAAHTLGINTTKSFYGQTTQQNIKYHDVFLYRQGVGPKPQMLRTTPTTPPVKTQTT